MDDDLELMERLRKLVMLPLLSLPISASPTLPPRRRLLPMPLPVVLELDEDVVVFLDTDSVILNPPEAFDLASNHSRAMEVQLAF